MIVNSIMLIIIIIIIIQENKTAVTVTQFFLPEEVTEHMAANPDCVWHCPFQQVFVWLEWLCWVTIVTFYAVLSPTGYTLFYETLFKIIFLICMC